MLYLDHSIEEVGAFGHSSDLLHDIEEAQEVDVGLLAFLLANHLDLALSTHLWKFAYSTHFSPGME